MPAEGAGGKRRGGGGKGRGRGQGRGGGRKRARVDDDRADDEVTRIQRLAAEHWPVSGGGTFKGEVVESVYGAYLRRHARGRAAATRLGALELSGYLERYLWPNLTDGASWEHVMSIVSLVNLKAREGVAVWSHFHAEPDRFAAFITRVVDLERSRPMSYAALTEWTTFMVHAYASLEDEMVRAHFLRLVSLPMWETLTPRHLQSLLASQPQLARPWKFLSKRRAKEAKAGGTPDRKSVV